MKKKYGECKRVIEIVDIENEMLQGIRIQDAEMMGMEEDQVRKEDILGDGVEVDEDEREVVKQHPKRAIYEKLEELKFKMDGEEVNCKQRWSIKKKKKGRLEERYV